MGRMLANTFAAKSFHVTLLEGQGATSVIPLSARVNHKKFFFYNELDLLLKKELRKPVDVVIHAAAVSDFSLASPYKGKMSSGKGLTLKLTPTKKIINDIRSIAPNTFLVGFKLETSIAKDHITPKLISLFHQAGCDLVVANKISGSKYSARLVESSGRLYPEVNSKQSLVKALLTRIEKIFL